MKTVKKRKFNYLHIICIGITLGFLLCGLLFFQNSVGRIIEGGRDFGLSFGYYFCELFEIPHGITPTVNDYPKTPFFPPLSPSAPVEPSAPSTSLPDNWDGFKANWASYWQLWGDTDNFIAYLAELGNVLFLISRIIVIALPFVLLVYLLIKRYFKKKNNDYDKDSKPLKTFKWLSSHFYHPVKNWVQGLFQFICDRKGYWVTWLCLWLFYFNIFTIILEFVAFYLYFVITFDFFNIYRQVYKLFLDLSTPFTFIPVWVWVIAAFLLFDRFRKNIAYARLRHYEMRNRGFINARPIVFMVCGTMGKKKTTAITDMALSQEVMFRDKAFEKILENDLKFPFFPWINLENAVKEAMKTHAIYNLATAKLWVSREYDIWVKVSCRENLYDYDYERYGLYYDDKLKVVNVWEIIEIYVQLYFIYIIQSSLLITNYSVRVDNLLSDLGNFPMWNSDFFKSDSRLIDSYSRHAHILDMDSLRLGKKLVSDNKYKDSFEFGVVVITEVGKERGNQVENRGLKADDKKANQKNDGFNKGLKMIRHSATVDNFPFVRMITDEQRPESLGADAKELCDIVHIAESGEMCLAMPFFSLAELLYSWLFGKFAGLYYQYRYVRSDNTLPMYLLKAFTAKIHSYYTGIYNRFGYCTLRVQLESGTQDGKITENKYYIMSKKIYSKRFSTDCFSDFFTTKALRSSVGIDDLREYATEKATFDELELQNSYFINDLLDGLNDDDSV